MTEFSEVALVDDPADVVDLPNRSGGSNAVLATVMKNMSISDTELALRMDVSKQTVSNWRLGRRTMREPVMRRVAEALGFPPRLFFESRAEAARWLIANRMGDFA